MTSISAWRCDICGKKFVQGDIGFNTHDHAKIFISGDVSGFLRQIDLNFEHICKECHIKLIHLLSEYERL